MHTSRAVGGRRVSASHARFGRASGSPLVNRCQNAPCATGWHRFQGYGYLDTTLAGYVKEDVLIRYDPADLAEIHVFHQDRFVCRAICQELAEQTVSLKEIEKARVERRKQVRVGLATRKEVVERFIAVHQEEALKPRGPVTEPEIVRRPRLKGYINE